MARKRKTDPAVLADAVSKVKAGEWDLKTAAESCGIAVSSMSTAVHRNDSQPLPQAVDVSADSTPLDRALDAAGCGSKGPEDSDQPSKGPSGSAPPPAPEEKKSAVPVISDADYCLQTVGMVKKVAVLGGGLLSGIPPTEDRLCKLGAMSKDFSKATEMASPQLAPFLKKWFPEGSALLAFAVAAAFEALGTWMAMKPLALEFREKRIREKKEAPEKTAEKVVEEKVRGPQNGPVQRESWMANIRGR